MTEWSDEQVDSAVRALDPVDADRLPEPPAASAAALLSDILEAPSTRRGRAPGWLPWAAAGVAAAAAIAIGVVVVAQESDAPESASATTSPTPPVDGTVPTGPPSLGSCVEIYSLDTLAHRAVAVDATVTTVAGDDVTFEVNRWFTGGEAPTVTLHGASTLGGLTSAGPSVDLSPGTRLLVAGDGGFAWGCGFTQPFDAAVAEEWASAFKG